MSAVSAVRSDLPPFDPARPLCPGFCGAWPWVPDAAFIGRSLLQVVLKRWKAAPTRPFICSNHRANRCDGLTRQPYRDGTRWTCRRHRVALAPKGEDSAVGYGGIPKPFLEATLES